MVESQTMYIGGVVVVLGVISLVSVTHVIVYVGPGQQATGSACIYGVKTARSESLLSLS